MMPIHTRAYRLAFVEYLRKGTPIPLATKQVRLMPFYIWRTRRDARVRQSHRMNDGRIFSWEDTPATGHPGEDYNCRCEAEPYIARETEYAYHDITTDLSSEANRWSNWDFVQHYYHGNGRSVDLREIGHLREIAEYFSFRQGAEGAFRRLSDQIADDARRDTVSPAYYYFHQGYDFESIAFSHGHADVKGDFRGSVSRKTAMLKISGQTRFTFSDWFKDPLDLQDWTGIALEPGGIPYQITGNWNATFFAQVRVQRTDSKYFIRDE